MTILQRSLLIGSWVLYLSVLNTSAQSESVVLSRGGLQVEFQKVVRGSEATVAFLSMESGSTRVKFDQSPLFQVSLQRLKNLERATEVITVPNQPIWIAAKDVAVARNGQDQIEIRMSNIPIPGSEQTVSVALFLEIREHDGALIWNGTARLNGIGDLFLVAFRYPYLSIESLGESGEDDFVAAPITGGLLMQNPISSS